MSFLSVISLFADKGEIVFEKGNHYIIETNRSYTVAEWYGGDFPNEGNRVIGDLNTYGLTDIYNISNRSEISVYIKDYFLNEDDAFEIVYELDGREELHFHIHYLNF